MRLLCACEHIARAPAPLPSEPSRGENSAWGIDHRNNLGGKILCPTVEHNTQCHSRMAASEPGQVHPMIRWAAGEVTTGAHSSCLKAGKCTKTFQLRQEVFLLKIGLYSHQALIHPFPQLAVPSSPWARAATLTSENTLPLEKLSATTARLALKSTAKLSGRKILTQPLLCKLFFKKKFS